MIYDLFSLRSVYASCPSFSPVLVPSSETRVGTARHDVVKPVPASVPGQMAQPTGIAFGEQHEHSVCGAMFPNIQFNELC